MEILQTEVQRRSKPVLVRLTPDIYDKLNELSAEAGGGVATTIRSILEAAIADGVEVVHSADAMKPARRRRRPQQAQASA